MNVTHVGRLCALIFTFNQPLDLSHCGISFQTGDHKLWRCAQSILGSKRSSLCESQETENCFRPPVGHKLASLATISSLIGVDFRQRRPQASGWWDCMTEHTWSKTKGWKFCAFPPDYRVSAWNWPTFTSIQRHVSKRNIWGKMTQKFKHHQKEWKTFSVPTSSVSYK